MTVYEDALKLHELHHGKLSIEPKVPCETPEDLTLAYTPGVAQPCLEINKDPENAYRYTGKGNTVAVVTLSLIHILKIWNKTRRILKNRRRCGSARAPRSQTCGCRPWSRGFMICTRRRRCGFRSTGPRKLSGKYW